ncbi:RNA polymerase sigma-70 factor (ECF subfamily) [Rhizobium sp. PP-F2F-G38]|uniref:Sigma-70 family RNA polymerase sigma factor n=1 Tax=Ferranicluibacter rubi TaxID=2715133 RepID=A0AA43ZEW2_9HYPH|nr:sigma-70 family RNA polymerase sigma factor [Ferranicluibacter rubi]NHT75592.1 sigma-70 family RNA polymerase sigma factor [Ferranicluibacter rubi]PYE30927.1 RNA polymerase sigma-70 factor (ECF subfamily) [Rhizobium sp. PP-WC-1G-195]PYE94381.1 RNA polymerase sigma-70 factor (ECF subfamily) [Rhizobium sp. PP-F2F-G38]
MTNIEVRHQVYVAQRPALVAYASRILGSRDTAEDIVQDAFLRFMPANAQETSSGQLVSYLYRIVRNLAFDVMKRQKLEARESVDPPYWTVPSRHPTPEDIVAASDELRLIERLLEDLPLETRIALEMHRFGGYTLSDIAAHLGISVATVHRHVRTGMVRLASGLAS